MSGRKTFWLAGLLALLMLACTAGAAFLAGFSTAHLVNQGTISLPVSLMPTPTPASPQSEEDAIQLFWDVWDIVRQSYYGDIPDIQTIIHGAIRGSLQTLGDQYTSFIDPRIAAIINEDASGEFQGIGAYVRMRDDGKLEIAGIIPNTPAEAAGLKSGDRVLAVDGQSIVGYSIYEAIALIRGPAGTQVTLLIERPGQENTFEVTITRARIEIPLVEAKMLEGNIAYIRLTDFSATATQQMTDALADLMSRNPKGLILDLRDNPGGLAGPGTERRRPVPGSGRHRHTTIQRGRGGIPLPRRRPGGVHPAGRPGE